MSGLQHATFTHQKKNRTKTKDKCTWNTSKLVTFLSAGVCWDQLQLHSALQKEICMDGEMEKVVPDCYWEKKNKLILQLKCTTAFYFTFSCPPFRMCMHQSWPVNLWCDRFAACVSQCSSASPPICFHCSPVSRNKNTRGMERKKEVGGGDGCFQMLTLLFVCNNNASNREDKSYRFTNVYFLPLWDARLWLVAIS